MGVPSEEQKLVFNQRCLLEGSLFENGLEEESNVYMIVHIEGGAKGKKKKKDVKKGKKKHKKKKVKLAILRYYKVEGEKVVRLRQQCRKCPPGTFLADHADRLYCGRCRSHYVKNQSDYLKRCWVKASVLLISNEKISDPAIVVNGVSSPRAWARPIAMAVLPLPGFPASRIARPWHMIT